MQRRTFILALAAIINSLMGAMVAMPGIRFLLDPLRRKRGHDEFIRITPLSAVSADRPSRVTVVADRWDAFVHHSAAPIGAVWLLRSDSENDEPRVKCLQTICPHLGCGIDFVAGRRVFVCPCHASEFDAAGKAQYGPSLRDMDELECRVSPPDENGGRWVEVKYQEFKTGVPDRRPLI